MRPLARVPARRHGAVAAMAWAGALLLASCTTAPSISVSARRAASPRSELSRSSDAGPRPPSVCEIAPGSGIASSEGVPQVGGPSAPRVTVMSACASAAELGQPCLAPNDVVLAIDY